MEKIPGSLLLAAQDNDTEALPLLPRLFLAVLDYV
jgi:hypothetical protein